MDQKRISPWVSLCLTVIIAMIIIALAMTGPSSPSPVQAKTIQSLHTTITDTITPTVTSVQPSDVPNDVNASVVIHGSGFTATISGTLVLTSPTVSLRDTALLDVIWVNSSTMTATVPWGMVPDTYSLTVTNPDGITGTLSDAITVTNGMNIFTADGPYGGQILDLHVNPLNPAHVYAVVDQVGLFISQDHGANWSLALSNVNMVNVTFDATDDQVITVGGGGELYYSTDGGQSWDGLIGRSDGQSQLHHCYIHKPVAHPTDTGVFYDAVQRCTGSTVLPDYSGVYLVQDDGLTWITRTQTLTDTDVSALAVHPTDGNILLAGTVTGNIFYSTDGGINWTWKHNVGPWTIRELYFDPSTLYAWTLYADSRLPAQSNAPDTMSVCTDTTLSSWVTNTISNTYWGVGALDFTLGKVWAGFGDLFVSTDTGQTWDRVTARDEPGEIPDTMLFTIDQDDPQIMYSDGNIQGIYKSVDSGEHWYASSTGLAGLVPYAMVVYPGNPDILYARASNVGLLWTRNGGFTWAVDNFWNGGFPGTSYLAVDPVIDTRLYLADAVDVPSAGIGVADQINGEWTTIYTSTFPLGSEEDCGKATAILVHPDIPGRMLAGAVTYPCDNEPDDFFGGTGHLFLSTDYGHTWTDVSPAGAIGWTGQFAASALDGQRMYASNISGMVLRSVDAGATWETGPSLVQDAHASRITVHPNDPDMVFVINATFEGDSLFRSEDGGITWDKLALEAGMDIVFTPSKPGAMVYTLYTACNFSENLCRSIDNGDTWTTLDGVPQPTSIAVGTDDQRVRLYLGSPGGVASTSAASVQALTASETVPGLNSLTGGGVFRMTTLLPDEWIYLPILVRASTP